MAWIEDIDYYRERDLPVYEEELAEFLPRRLLDCHVHCFLKEHQDREPTEEERAKSLGSDERSFAVEDMHETHRLLFPRQEVDALIFGTASAYHSIPRQNRYVGEVCRGTGCSGLALLSPSETEDALCEMLDETGLLGLKPYDSLTGKPLPEVTIPDMVPEAARRVVERRGLIIMLHVPRPGRIADPANIREVVELCEACPNARVILAHIGRSYGPWYIEQAIDQLAALPNLYYDVAALDDADSICVVLEHVPHTRLLFGTDLPFAAERGKHLCVNRQCLFLTRKQHPWSISSQEPGKLQLTFMAYETVRALRRACQRLRLTREQVEDIMHGNARRLLDAAGARHEGSTR